jgi:hypothetical protein
MNEKIRNDIFYAISIKKTLYDSVIDYKSVVRQGL